MYKISLLTGVDVITGTVEKLFDEITKTDELGLAFLSWGFGVTRR